MKKRVVFSILLAIALIPAVVVLAAYSSSILVQNTSGVDYPMVGGYSSANISFMAANGIFASVNGTDARVKYGATDQHFMLAEDRVAYATSISQHASKTLTFSTGNNASASNVFSIVPGYGGYVTTNDTAALEPSSNFSLLVNGYINTAIAANITDKTAALNLATDGAGNVTASITVSQPISTAVMDIYSARTRGGQRIDTTNFTLITSVGFRLNKNGNPTGTANITIRKVSDDSILGIVGTQNVTNLSAAAAQYTYSTTPVLVPYGIGIRILVEYSGGDGANTVQVAYDNADVVATQSRTEYTGVWTDFGLTDATFDYAPAISISGVASANMTLTSSLSGGTFSLTNGVLSASNLSTPVPNNTNNWTFGGNSTPYFDYIKLTKGGNEKLWYQPTSILSLNGTGATMPDRDGAQDGFITWGSFPPGVTANMSGLVSDYDPGAGTSGDGQDIAPSTNGTAHATTGDAAKTTILMGDPLWGIWNAIDVAIQGAIPGGSLPPLLQMEILTLLLALLGFVIVYAQFAHLLIAGIVFCIPFGYRVAQHTMEWWVIPILVLWLIGCAIMENRQTVG